MKVTIFSGGTGSIALSTGLKKLFPEIEITHLLNAYDDGKSTGIVRKMYNCLGPSDIRKVQWLYYSLSHKNIDKRLEVLYNDRVDLNKIDVKKYLDLFKDNEYFGFKKYLNKAFNLFIDNIDHYFVLNSDNMKDFNLMNLVYASMFSHPEFGYKSTIDYFNKVLGIEDTIDLVSYDNLSLCATTKYNKELICEADIVNYNNPNDKIQSIYFVDSSENYQTPLMNPKIKTYIEESDMIIISPGTEWSSLIPSFIDQEEEIINLIRNHPLVIKVINNEYDLDSVGVSNKEIISHYRILFENLNNFNIIINLDARKELQMLDLPSECGIYIQQMDNIDGKHNPDKLAKFILNIFLRKKGFLQNTILIDFDDTLWQRLEKNEEISIENIKLLNELGKYKKIHIISGNSYESIKSKLLKVFTLKEFYNLNFSIRADGGSNLYEQDQIVTYLEDNYVCQSTIDLVENVINTHKELLGNDSIHFEKRGIRPDDRVTCLAIKPISKLLRKLFCEYLNLHLEKENVSGIGIETGFATIEVKWFRFNKSLMLEHIPDLENTIYIGDECDYLNGNDYEISKKCTDYYNVDSIKETNTLLKVLLFYKKRKENETNT